MSGRVEALLDESFGLLRRGAPQALARMGERLEGRSVHLTVGAESFAVSFGAGGAWIGGEGDAEPAARVQTDVEAVLEVLDAELSLHDAVLQDRVRVRGGIDDLLRVEGALRSYVHGAVRADGFAELLARFRRSSSKPAPLPPAASESP